MTSPIRASRSPSAARRSCSGASESVAWESVDWREIQFHFIGLFSFFWRANRILSLAKSLTPFVLFQPSLAPSLSVSTTPSLPSAPCASL
jgi:hypothetical protein